MSGQMSGQSMGRAEMITTRQTKKLTTATVGRALAARTSGRRTKITDTAEPALTLQVGPTGGVYYASLRAGGVTFEGKRHPVREYRLGTTIDITPEAARIAVAGIRNDLANGIDPRKEAAAQAAAAAARKTLGEVAAAYTAARLGGGTAHHRQQALHVRLGVEELGPAVAGAWVGDVKQAHLQRVIDLHVRKPATARHRAGALDRMMRWAVRSGYLDENPFKDHERPKPPAPRQRSLSAADMQALWNLDDPAQQFTRFALLVPLRASEIAELRPENIDLARRAVVLDGKQTKNGDAFAMPLVDAALALITERLAATTPGQRLFQLNLAGGPMNAWTPYYRRTRKVASTFTLHDLRRLFVSVLAEQGRGDADTTDSLLNHRQSETKGGVRAHYHQADLWPRQVKVMRDWADLVAHALEHGAWPSAGAEVVSLAALR